MFAEHSILADARPSRLPARRCVLCCTSAAGADDDCRGQRGGDALAGNLWVAVLAGPGFVTAAEHWFYIDAFSAFHIVVLVLVFLLSSAFAGVYFTSRGGEHDFTPPRRAPLRRAVAGLARGDDAGPGVEQSRDHVGRHGGDDAAQRLPDLAVPEPALA